MRRISPYTRPRSPEHPPAFDCIGSPWEGAGAGWRGREGAVKPNAAEDPYTDLIACERDCRTCSYAAWLDCDGNCGVCPHNGYCPCVNPVVARSKTALRLIELRPILLQDLQARN